MIENLEKIAKNVRIDIIDMVYAAQSGHPGGSLGIADVMVGIYFYAMVDGDKFVLSKGHCSPALYGVLAEKGLIPKEDLKGFRQANSYLQGHPSRNEKIEVDMSTGSLGQGISAACGMAKAFKINENHPVRSASTPPEEGNLQRVYCVMGDGEQDEGQVWEAATFAAHYGLDNLCAVVDLNGLQIDGATKDVMNTALISDRYRAFNWNVIEIDGNNFEQILGALDKAKEFKGKPTVIIAKTIKGKGVSFMENNYEWHGKAPNKEQYELAREELESL